MKAARIFLYIVAILTFLVVAAFFALRIWSDELSALAFVPDSAFTQQQPLASNAYANPAMWLSRPGEGMAGSASGHADNPARWQPAYAAGTAPPAPAAAAPVPRFAAFFIHPTSYFDKSAWNAPLDDAASQERARLFLKGLASPFNQADQIWAPRYRQATIGAFLTDDPRATQALDAAYRDVEQAFDYFLTQVPQDEPIVLAGHSQGSLHLLRLLASHIAGTAAQKRIAMVYAIGWPISLDHDLPRLGLPACANRDQTGCIVSWVSFAEPADTGQLMKRYDSSPAFDGKPRAGGPILCTNPIDWTIGGAAPAKDNLGTLVPDADLKSGKLVPGMVPAHCDARGILLIGDPPDLGAAVLPGNNYHVYDIPLFWRDLQLDVAHRMSLWTSRP